MPLHGLTTACLCGIFSAAAPSICAQQTSPLVNSNIESVSSRTPDRFSQAQSTGPLALPGDLSKLRLAPGYSVALQVFGIPELTQTLQVDKDGVVVLPLAGPLMVGGDTLREAERAIAQVLSDKELVNSPTVTLTLTQYTPAGVVVSGEVQSPGEIRILGPEPLLRVLADAGGVTTSSGGDIELRHHEDGGMDTVRHIPYVRGAPSPLAEGATVYPGDTLFVVRAGVVYVLGAVARPGGYLMVNNGTLNLPEAVGLALGYTLIASAKTVIVVRNVENQPKTYHLRLDRMSKGEEPSFRLADGDMVYVPTSGVKATLVNYSSLISATAAAGIYGGLNR